MPSKDDFGEGMLRMMILASQITVIVTAMTTMLTTLKKKTKRNKLHLRVTRLYPNMLNE